jgi:hypothetical protein
MTLDRRRKLAWGVFAAVIAALAIGFIVGGWWVLLAPVVLVAYAVFLLFSPPPANGVRRHHPYADGVAGGRYEAEEREYEAEERAHDAEALEEEHRHRESAEEARRGYDARGDAGPPPNVPFP